MAIDRMKKLTILCPTAAAQRLSRTLYDLGAVEIVDTQIEPEQAEGHFKRHSVSMEECDLHLSKINLVLTLIDEFAPDKKGFFEGLTPLPIIVEPSELATVPRDFDLEAVYQKADELDDARKHADRLAGEIRIQLESLSPFGDLPFAISDFRKTQRTRLVFGTVPTRAVENLNAKELADVLAWERVVPGQALRAGDGDIAPTKSDRVRVVAAFLPEDEDAARRLLAANQFEETPLPNVTGSVRDRIRELTGDLTQCDEERANVRAKVLELVRHRRALLVLRAYWDGIRRRRQARGTALEGRWLHVLSGYCRTLDLERVERVLTKEVPEAVVVAEDPTAEDDVPISITLPKLVRPVYMLISLFGLPSYSAFDPSPFIILPFYLFFGICFGDVGYGLMLIALGWFLSRKTKQYEGVHNFAQLLYFAGFSTVVFGALLGSWFGDLYLAKYLGEGNAILVLKEKFMVLDPLADPVTMLVTALFIGILNQLYGIVLKMHGAARDRDWQTVAFDGLLWLIALPGLVLLIGSFLGALGPFYAYVGKLLFLTGAIGLVFTQGRSEKGIVSKAVTGVVSIYGILGSYGAAAFIGDTLSYCRLLALGLTTSIVAMCVNMIGDLVRPVPYVGFVLFIAVLVLGHLFNFAISLLGAFVHSMRLIFVELFGRFYSGGSREFRPLGFDSDSCQLSHQSRANG